MRVREVIWLPEIEDKLWEKHRLTVAETEEMLFSEPISGLRKEAITTTRTCMPLTGRQKQVVTSLYSSCWSVAGKRS